MSDKETKRGPKAQTEMDRIRREAINVLEAAIEEERKISEGSELQGVEEMENALQVIKNGLYIED